MPVYIDLELPDKDPLDLIERNKDIVRHLRGNGIDGFEIKNILDNSYGLRNLDLYITDAVTSRILKEQHQIDYAMRHLKSLVNNDAITDDEKKCLLKIWERLRNEYFPPIETVKKGWPVLKIERRKGDAKSEKQMVGRQVAAINKYIRPFNKIYLQKDIFDLIAELFEIRHDRKYTQKQIENFDKNNC
ncbi:MAG TPA: hypothetical protein P5244_12265 [Syntrophales bacterium]|nr:hypothetical protein [Syntrophales bacterium]